MREGERNNRRGGFRGRRRHDDRPQRRFSEDRVDRNEPNERDDDPQFKRKFIKRDQNDERGGSRRGGRHHDKKRDDRDLDRELRDYWITKNGGDKQGDVKELARQKLNSEMDDYWKNRQQNAGKEQ